MTDYDKRTMLLVSLAASVLMAIVILIGIEVLGIPEGLRKKVPAKPAVQVESVSMEE